MEGGLSHVWEGLSWQVGIPRNLQHLPRRGEFAASPPSVGIAMSSASFRHLLVGLAFGSAGPGSDGLSVVEDNSKLT